MEWCRGEGGEPVGEWRSMNDNVAACYEILRLAAEVERLTAPRRLGQLEDWTRPSGKLGEIMADFVMLRDLGGGNQEAETADTKANIAWETWVRTKDARRAIAAERARIRRELLKFIQRAERERMDDRSPLTFNEDDLRAEIDRIVPGEG